MSLNTPHIKLCSERGFAESVLMPGDPLRAKYLAENYLTDAVLVNNVRGVQGYTGLWKGVPVSVMASGMGMPSMGIYSYELFNIFGVERILRIGSAGGISPKVKVRDLVLGMGACTDSAYAAQYGLEGTIAPIAAYPLLKRAEQEAAAMGIDCHVGALLSSDFFYSDGAGALAWQKMGVLAVEMEAAALYLNAARAGREALAICTVSDHLVTGEATSPEERERGFTAMMQVALNTVT